jgi:uncharacterized protein YlaN (UPF0358 family)
MGLNNRTSVQASKNTFSRRDADEIKTIIKSKLSNKTLPLMPDSVFDEFCRKRREMNIS